MVVVMVVMVVVMDSLCSPPSYSRVMSLTGLARRSNSGHPSRNPCWPGGAQCQAAARPPPPHRVFTWALRLWQRSTKDRQRHAIAPKSCWLPDQRETQRTSEQWVGMTVFLFFLLIFFNERTKVNWDEEGWKEAYGLLLYLQPKGEHS